MIRIRLYDHPLAAFAPKEYQADSLGEWLLAHYGPAPAVRVQVFRGEPCLENEITNDLHALLRSDCDEYVILQSPGGIEWLIYAAIIATVAAVATILLTPKPVMPGNINRTQQSPNNALGSRENKVRLLERVEDIYGTVKSIPSLMMPTYNKYIGNQKFEYGYYCVGRGYHSLTELRDADTLIADIPGASAAVYDPFTSPNSGHSPVLQIGTAIIDDVLTVSRAIEVDGITLKAPNQVQLPLSAAYTFSQSGSTGSITQAVPQPNFNALIAVGDIVVVSMSSFSVTSGGEDDGMGGTTPIITSGPYNYSFTYSVLSVSNGEIVVPIAPGSWKVATTQTCSLQLYDKTNYTSWVTLPDLDRTEVWANITAPNGLFKDSGGKSVVEVFFTLEVEQLNAGTLAPTGNVQTASGSLAGSVSDERADTLEFFTGWVGPARVRMRRTTDYDYAFNGQVQDEIKWADLYSVSPVTKTQFGNKTTIHTVTQATARATAVKSRQLNCIAARRLPTYNGSTFSGAFNDAGSLISGTISPSSKICDIIAAVSADPKIGARNLATEVDMAQIWAVQQQLDAWSPASGQFNFTFDSDNTSFEEHIITIANAGFCIPYRQNGKIRLALDRAQSSSTALFTHRNKRPNAETITRNFASDADYDGVEFVFVDAKTNQSETITLPLSGLYTKLKKFEIPGIRNYTQAWFRANREYAKLTGQRVTIDSEMTTDARLLLPNARIDIVDNTRFKSFDGEVVGQSGLEVTLSRDVAFAPATAHSIVLMRRDGGLQSIACTAGSAPNKVLLAGAPAEAIVTSYGADGIRTIFSFAADSARAAQAWLVQEIGMSDGQYIRIRAVNYSASYYAADYAAVPAKASVIN